MYLRAVSIRGFKSFAEKVVLRFEPGITVVVGPNGSGKSNITDGILWALGEQSAKSLRGSSMEDVIFSGSANKKALGAAEVSLTLDNTDGAIPIDFTEVTIARRLYRSGESEYRINGTSCRLIDITEILQDSGLGREMYSIISQGHLDDMLNCRPKERRRLLEEAAGVLKHKRRRDRALRKLAAMERNLVRGKDIVREINRQLAPLSKQAELAREHERLSAELHEAQVSAAVGRLRLLRRQWEQFTTDHDEKKARIEEFTEDLEKVQGRIDELEQELEEKGVLSGDISEYRRRFASLRERINSGLLLLEEKGKNLIGKISELRGAIHSLEARAAAARKERDSLLAEQQGLDEELGALYGRLNKGRRESESVRKAAKAASEALLEAESRLNRVRDRRADLERDINRRNSLVESTTEKVAFLHEQLAAVSQKKEALEEELAAVEAEHRKLDEGLPELQQQAVDRRRAAEDYRAAREKAAENLERLTAEMREAEAKRAALEAVESNARSGSSWIDEEKTDFRDIVGSVGSLIAVEPKYEKALEAALGPDAYALIAKDRPRASRIFERARDRGSDPVRVLTAGASIDAPDLGAGVTRVTELIDCDASARAAVDALLGHVWVTADLDDFVSGRRQAPPGGLVVDLEGNFVDGRGLIVRGRADDGTQGSLALRREISALEVRIAQSRRLAEEARSELEELKAKTRAAEDEAAAAQTTAQKQDSVVVGVGLRLHNLKRDAGHLAGQDQDIRNLLTEKTALTEETEAGLRQLQAELEDVVGEVAKFTEEHAAKRESQLRGVEEEKQATAALSEAQVGMASLTERQRHIKSRTIAVTGELERAEQSLAQQKKIVEATEELRHRIQPVHDLYAGLLSAAAERADVLEATDDREQAGAASLREELRGLHQRARDLGADLTLVNSELVGRAESKAQVEAEVGQITKLLTEELGVALETALTRPVDGREPEDWAARERRLRERLAGMGPVNQIAGDEFGKLEERQSFLNKQIDDLTRSHQALKKVIKAIDVKIRDRFQATFDEVSANFEQVFQELFPGGSARLVLVEDEDGGEEPGVDIEAQPEGKKVRALSLMSGGERSLVGLALMFATHHTRPSPFYILDEVEAALDVINLGRFIHLMKTLKEKSQFLVITHQRPTMEIADSIYGVSMQADGVSKVISQKLEIEEIENGRRAEEELVAAAVGRPPEVEDQP